MNNDKRIFFYIPPGIRPYMTDIKLDISKGIDKIQFANKVKYYFNGLYYTFKEAVDKVEESIKQKTKIGDIPYVFNRSNTYKYVRKNVNTTVFKNCEFKINSKHVNKDIMNISNSNYVVVFLPNNKVMGYLATIGLAIGLNKPVLVYGDIKKFKDHSIFSRHKNIILTDTLDECLRIIKRDIEKHSLVKEDNNRRIK